MAWRVAAAGSAVDAVAVVDGTMPSSHRIAPVIDHLDHLVLTTVDAPVCVDFYTRVLCMRLETFADDRQATSWRR